MAGEFAVEVARALSLLPRVPAVMTAAFEHKRGGLLVDRLMACSNEPPSIAIAIHKGHRLATLIRDSHSFAINLIEPKDRLIVKKFDAAADADAFELMEHRGIVTGAPCLSRSVACLDCDVMRHFDLEADHEMYIGLIVGAWIPPTGEVVVTPNGQYAEALLAAGFGRLGSSNSLGATKPAWSGHTNGNGHHAGSPQFRSPGAGKFRAT